MKDYLYRRLLEEVDKKLESPNTAKMVLTFFDSVLLFIGWMSYNDRARVFGITLMSFAIFHIIMTFLLMTRLRKFVKGWLKKANEKAGITGTKYRIP